MKKVMLKIDGMHCTSCAMNIDGELEDTQGITNATTNYAKQEAEVTFDESLVNEEKIISIIKEVGYTATSK